MADVALVTGGTGFLGTHLARTLRDMGWGVHITSRSESGCSEPGIVHHVCDFADPEAGSRVLEAIQPSLVYHLAAAVTARPDMEFVLPTLRSHLLSAVNLMTLAGSMPGTRIVLSGSMNEGTSETPSSPYAAAKIATRTYARMFHSLYSTPLVFVRPFPTFGPGQHESKVLPYVIRSLASGEAPKISSGNWRADWIYVSDVIDGFVKAGLTPGIEGQEIELGRGELVSLHDMVARIAELMEVDVAPNFGAVEDRPEEPERIADIAATRELIGWEPMVSLDQGLSKTIAAFS